MGCVGRGRSAECRRQLATDGAAEIECGRKNSPSFFEEYGEQAREILDAMLAKYADLGPFEFSIPDSLKVPPISALGNIPEIIDRFGDANRLRTAVTRLQELIYAA